jgi:putative sigma-54 modulation protein
MELQITGKNTKVSAPVRRLLERKIGNLARHLPNITEAEVELSTETTRSQKHRYVVQVTLNSDGTFLRGEEKAADIYTAVNSVVAVMDRQIERYKGRLYHKGRGVSPTRSEPLPSAEMEAATPAGKPVRTKRFDVKPMSLDEAAEQMELLDHDFFFFLNAATGQFNVLYRRSNEEYGLIEPQV